MAEPMSPERLAEIRRRVEEVADYTAEGLLRNKPEYKDRADLLAEVNGLRSREHALGEEVSGLRAEVERLRTALLEYENTITWFTTCHGCAAHLDTAVAAEAERDHLRAELERLRRAAAPLIGDGVTPEIARYVLRYFDAEGGEEYDEFTALLLAAIHQADRAARIRLARSYLGYVTAYTLAAGGTAGLDSLRVVARSEMVACPPREFVDAQAEAERAALHGSCLDEAGEYL